MKIIRVEPIHLRLTEVNERCDGSQETLIVKVYTDANLVGIGRRHFLDHVELTGLQIDQAHRRVGDRSENDAVEMDRCRVPITGIAVQRHVVLRHPLDEAERARADRVGEEILAHFIYFVQYKYGISRFYLSQRLYNTPRHSSYISFPVATKLTLIMQAAKAKEVDFEST